MQQLKGYVLDTETLTEFWKNRLKTSNGTALFAYILSDRIAETHKILINLLEQVPFRKIINTNSIISWIESTLVLELGFYIARVYVYEMHSAKRRNLLLGETSEEKFFYFLEEFSKEENLSILLKKYQALNTIIDELFNQFISSSRNFIFRLIADTNEINYEFMGGSSDFVLEEIVPSGDKHCNGERVFVLSFTSGKEIIKILYKPKPLGIDINFQKFLHWLNKNCSADLYCIKIIPKNSYGWCEFIEHKFCENEDELKQYYSKLGSILAITYILNGTDLHSENIIAHGKYPVIVDYECFFTPLWNQTGEKPVLRPLVSKSLILPYKTGVNESFDGYDISGLSVKANQKSAFKGFSWVDQLTDNMLFTREDLYISGNKNSPTMNREEFDLQKYKDNFINGFELTYREILNKREFLLFSETSPINFFKNCHIRILFRATSTYAKLLMESNHPKLLLSNDNLLEHFNFLKKISTDLVMEDISASETHSLMKLNVPLFYTSTDEQLIYDSFKQPTTINVVASGYDCVRKIINDILSEDDLNLQIKLIVNSFKAAYINDLLDGKRPSFNFHETFNPYKMLAPIKMANTLVDSILRNQINIDDKIYWPTITIEHEKVWAPALTSPISLFSGNLGIALTFAWAAKLFENDSYKQIAQTCMTTMRNYFNYREKEVERFLGFHSGAGGLLFILGQLYKLWKDEAILNDILKTMNMLDKYISEDYTLDIIGGSAGCILGLHSVSNFIDSNIIKSYIEKCVDRIISIYPDPTKLPHREVQISSQPLLGFSHGIAGFTYSLVIASKYIVRPLIQDWIRWGLEYERNNYNEDIENWADFRLEKRELHNLAKFYEKKQVKGMVAWCHGAPGIALSRMGMKRFGYTDKYIHDEIMNALSITMKYGFNTDNACLCHGLLGNMDTLLMAKEDGYLSDAAFNECLNQVIENINHYGILSNNQLSCDTIPGFMLGSSGVAYQLMRLSHKEIMPSVLIAA